MRLETIERTHSQKHIYGGQNEVRLGSDGMSAAFLVEFHVRAGRGVNSLQASLDQPRRSGTQLDLAECEAQLTISVEPARRQYLGHAAFQTRARGEDQVMIGGEQRLRHHGLDGRAQMLGGRAQCRRQRYVHEAARRYVTSELS